MSQTIRYLKGIQTRIDEVIQDLEDAPEKADIIDLIKACEFLDEDYKENFCDSNDRMESLPIGTTYNEEHGEYMEYYCEASAWHEVSKILRKMRTNNGCRI